MNEAKCNFLNFFKKQITRSIFNLKDITSIQQQTYNKRFITDKIITIILINCIILAKMRSDTF